MPKVEKKKGEAFNPSKKARGWVLTLNNYTEDEVTAFDAIKSQYKIRGFEVAPSTNTPHLQGYVYFKHQIVWKRLNKAIPRGRWRIAKGTAEQNRVYCSKEGKFTEDGETPQTQGTRNDITDFVQKCKESEEIFDEGELIEDHSVMTCKYPAFVARTQRYYHPPTTLVKQENYWFYGGAGTGKTEWAKRYGAYYVKECNKWWDGYCNEPVVVVQDISPDQATFMLSFLKRWSDWDPFTVMIKNSSAFIRPKIIIVTSNYAIDEMSWDGPSTAAMQRRFTQREFVEKYDWHKEQALLATMAEEYEDSDEDSDDDSDGSNN